MNLINFSHYLSSLLGYWLLYHRTTPKLDYGTIKHDQKDALELPVRVRHVIGSPGIFQSKALYCTSREFVKENSALFPILTSETSAWLPKMLMVSVLCMHLWLTTRSYRAELAWHFTQFLCLINIFHTCCPCTYTAWIFYNHCAPILLTLEIFSALTQFSSFHNLKK